MGAFTLPLVVLGVGVIGLWLLGGKKSTTSPPDSMPKLNSAVRGTPIPVTFGTNKISAQITWSKNFRADPQSSGGKGKPGGSGGFGSAKGGGSGGAQYLYYWDMMFDYGILDQPSGLRRGWVGGDPITDASMAALTSGGSTAFANLIALVNRTNSTKTATLNYTSAFIGQGWPTSDTTDLTTWTYFQSQEGVACAFPYIGWVGFEQLELGQTPSVPQLFFEWVPNSAGLNYATPGHYLSCSDAVSNLNDTYLFPLAQDDAGNFYNVYATTTGIATVGLKTSVAVTMTFATMNANIQSIPAFSGVSIGSATPIAIDGQPYIYVYTMPLGMSGSPIGYVIQCYHVNNDGTLTFKNCAIYQEAQAPFGGNMGRPIAVGMTVLGEMIMAGRCDAFTSSQPGHLLVVHDLSFFLSGTQPVWNAAVGQRHMTTTFGGFDLLSDPFWNVKVGFVNNAAQMVIYYGPTDMDNAPIGSYAASQKTFFPDGCLVVADIFSDNAGVLTWTLIGPFNGFIKDTAGNNLIPYSDVDHSGSGDYTAPQQYGQIITMTRNYTSDLFKAGIRLAYADPITGDVIAVGQVAGDYFTSSDHASPGPVAWQHAQLANNELVITSRISGGFGNYVSGTFGVALGNSVDVTPAYIIYRILTSDVFGFATNSLFGFTISSDRVDQASYIAAVAECVRQGCFISVTYSNQQSVLQIINDLLALYGGFLTENDGVISFGFVKDNEASVRTLDNSHLVGTPPVTVTKAATDDGYNKIVLNYLDREIDYNQNQVEAEDPVDYDINGPRIKTWDTQFVMAGSLATQIVQRALWANLYGRDTFAFKTGWKDADLRPGQCVTIVDSFDATLNGGVQVRLMNRKATDKRGIFEWSAVQEYAYITAASTQYTNNASISPGFSSLVQPISAASWQTAYELAKEVQGNQAELYFGYGQASQVMGAQLYLSTDSGGTFVKAKDMQPFIISGQLAAPLEDRPKGYVDEFVEFYIFCSNTFSVATPSYFQNYNLADITPSTRAAGAGNIIVGSECIALETLTLLGQNHYRARRAFRGWAGSPITSHNSGAVFHAHGPGIFIRDITVNDIGTTLYYKIVPYNFAGQTYNVSSVPQGSYKIKGLYWLPREQPRTHFWVNSALSWPASTEVTGPYIGVTSGGADLIMTWSNADNAEGYGAGGYGAGGYGHFLSSDSLGWRVDISSKNGTPVSSFVVNTMYFDYTIAQNSKDFNGFGRDLVVKVTPFTIKGDGPVTDTRSISINW